MLDEHYEGGKYRGTEETVRHQGQDEVFSGFAEFTLSEARHSSVRGCCFCNFRPAVPSRWRLAFTVEQARRCTKAPSSQRIAIPFLRASSLIACGQLLIIALQHRHDPICPALPCSTKSRFHPQTPQLVLLWKPRRLQMAASRLAIATPSQF